MVINFPLPRIVKLDFGARNFKSLSAEKMHYYSVPSLFAKQVFQLDCDILISAVRARVGVGDLVIYRLDGTYFFGNMANARPNEWIIKNCADSEIYALGDVKNPRKVIGYNIKSVISDEINRNAVT